MNGAAAVPASSINVPNRRSTSTRPVTHHFLLCRIKNHKSERKPLFPSSDARVSKSFIVGTSTLLARSKLTEVALEIAGLGLRLPVRRDAGVTAPLQRIAPDGAKKQRDGGEKAVEDRRQQHARHDPADGRGDGHRR